MTPAVFALTVLAELAAAACVTVSLLRPKRRSFIGVVKNNPPPVL
ncbi:MAG: hypothetical protein FD146_544 [Anaerolineaceae bacterium]|nr:MAG: hypothetical protein FD146_544 [Anaerolineaceae bacterium]